MQLAFLLSNLRHPSLRAKKYDEAIDIWQARVDDGYRFYFQIDGETYLLLSIIPHPK
jgi:mRNA interferase RelE/StbE